jgi:hypothetical protein
MLHPRTAGRVPTIQRIAIDVVPAVVTGVVVITGLLALDTPVVAILRYTAFVVFAVLLPGTLVHRSLRGRNPLLVADLALGGATGVGLSLLAWAAFMLAGVQQYLWLWPLAVFVPFIGVPRLRTHWRLGGHTERSRVTSWLLAAGVSLYALSLVVSTLRFQDLPPKPNQYYIDVYWHLANAAELTRHLPPDVPSVADRPLRYHWFFNAFLGESHLISGVDLPTLMLRFWEIPLVALVLGLVVAVGRKATGANWPAGLAALIVVAPAQLVPWSWYQPWSSSAFVSGSPSLAFGLVPLLLAAHVLIGLVRGERIRGGWLVLLLAVLLAPGSKPSVLAVLLGGTGCVLLANLVRRRPVRRVLAAMAMVAAAFVALGPLVAQAAAASGVKLFGLLYFVPIWKLYNQDNYIPSTGGFMLAGMDDTSTVVFALLLVLSILLQYAWVLAGIPLLRRRTRTDNAVVFLAGGFIASVVATLVIDHAGASEIYFARTGVPFAAILAAWGLYVALPRGAAWSVRRRSLAIAGVATATGLIIVASVLRAGKGPIPPVEDLPRELAIPLGVLLALSLLAVAAWWLARATPLRRVLKGIGMALFCATVIAVFLIQGPWSTAKRTNTALTTTRPPLPDRHVTTRETLAAQWVQRNVPRDDIIATNVHCRFKKTVPHCDVRAYWVAAFTERRLLVESWAYTEETLQQIGHQPGSFVTFSFDDPAKLALNEKAFHDPTPEDLATLRDRYHVKWLFGDRLASPVSPKLRDLATLRLSNTDVQVYELKP